MGTWSPDVRTDRQVHETPSKWPSHCTEVTSCCHGNGSSCSNSLEVARVSAPGVMSLPRLKQTLNKYSMCLIVAHYCLWCFDTVGCLGHQEDHPACINWVTRHWHGYLSGTRCKWYVYGPADATVTPSSLAPVKSRMVYPSRPGYLGCRGKEAIKRVCVHQFLWHDAAMVSVMDSWSKRRGFHSELLQFHEATIDTHACLYIRLTTDVPRYNNVIHSFVVSTLAHCGWRWCR